MDKMTNDERLHIAVEVRELLFMLERNTDSKAKEIEKVHNLLIRLTAPEREYPTGEWKLSQDGESLFHGGTRMILFPTFMEEVDKRMLRKAKEMYKFIKGRGPQHRTDEESFLLDYIETGADNESSK